MAVLEPEPEGAEVATLYRSWAAEHSTEALKDFRSKRPIRSAQHTEAMHRLKRAALAEQFDPVPPRHPGDVPQAPPPEPPAPPRDHSNERPQDPPLLGPGPTPA